MVWRNGHLSATIVSYGHLHDGLASSDYLYTVPESCCARARQCQDFGLTLLALLTLPFARSPDFSGTYAVSRLNEAEIATLPKGTSGAATAIVLGVSTVLKP